MKCTTYLACDLYWLGNNKRATVFCIELLSCSSSLVRGLVNRILCSVPCNRPFKGKFISIRWVVQPRILKTQVHTMVPWALMRASTSANSQVLCQLGIKRLRNPLHCTRSIEDWCNSCVPVLKCSALSVFIRYCAIVRRRQCAFRFACNFVNQTGSSCVGAQRGIHLKGIFQPNHRKIVSAITRYRLILGGGKFLSV